MFKRGVCLLLLLVTLPLAFAAVDDAVVAELWQEDTASVVVQLADDVEGLNNLEAVAKRSAEQHDVIDELRGQKTAIPRIRFHTRAGNFC